MVLVKTKKIQGKVEAVQEKRTERVGIGTGIGTGTEIGTGSETKIVIVIIETTTETGVTEGSGDEIEMMIMTTTGVEIMTGNTTGAAVIFSQIHPLLI